MSRIRLRRPNQPLALRVVLGLVEFFASLKLAVVLIFGAAALLGTGTFVEKEYGTPAAHFAIYQTWWFGALHGLLALNIFFAAAVRYPWKRHQTGFVITHIGLLTLLFGCLLQRIGGIDAQLMVYEGERESVGYEDEQFFQLSVLDDSGDDEASEDDPHSSLMKKKNWIPLKPISFVGGPFNWDDLDKMSFLPWRIPRFGRGRVDRGLIYDSEGIQIEVLDYYSDCDLREIPYVEFDIEVSNSEGSKTVVPLSMGAESLDRMLARVRQRRSAIHRKQLGRLPIGVWKASSQEETEAFERCLPRGDLGLQGQVALYAGGTVYHLPVLEGRLLDREIHLFARSMGFLLSDEIADAFYRTKFPLGDTGISVDVLSPNQTALSVGSLRSQQVVQLKINAPGQLPQTMKLYSDEAELNVHDLTNNIFGYYWIDHRMISRMQIFLRESRGEKISEMEKSMAEVARTRIDVLQGADMKLRYRAVDTAYEVTGGVLPDVAAEKFVEIKQLIPNGVSIRLKVDRFISSEDYEVVPDPKRFDKEVRMAGAIRATKIRFKVDDQEVTQWLIGLPLSLAGPVQNRFSRIELTSSKRAVAIELPLTAVDIGVEVELHDFERRLDPGTSSPSHYSSEVDFYDKKTGGKLNSDSSHVVISMNAPVDIIDPNPDSGKTYRLFQENFLPQDEKWGPDSIQYKEHVPPGSDREDLFLSVLTINYDPGRAAKYLGCLFIVSGIGTMFYMRAYFFKPRKKQKSANSL